MGPNHPRWWCLIWTRARRYRKRLRRQYVCWWTCAVGCCGLLVKTNATWFWKPPKMCWEWQKCMQILKKEQLTWLWGASSNFKYWIWKVNQHPQNKWLILNLRAETLGPRWKWCMSTTVLECYIGKPSMLCNWLGEEACRSFRKQQINESEQTHFSTLGKRVWKDPCKLKLLRWTNDTGTIDGRKSAITTERIEMG